MPSKSALPLTIFAMALLYVALYRLNEVLFDGVVHAGYAGLVYLPAIVRLLAVLLIGPWAIVSLFIGAAWVVELPGGLSAAEALLINASLALGAPLAILLAMRQLSIPRDLAGLGPAAILILSLASAFGNTLSYNAAILAIDGSRFSPAGVGAVFIGDTIGTWLAIFAIKLGIAAFARRSE